MPLLSTIGASSSRPYGFLGPFKTIGETSYTTAGTFSWVCPAGVTSVCVVCIGPGEGNTSQGRGGGLGWKNNIAVTPGQSYTVVVGAANSSTNSYFINTSTVMGRAGNQGGTFVGDGGGNGGASTSWNGGGGAGGYSGNGGNGGYFGVGAAGAGGGGGGGGFILVNAGWGSASGGGTGIFGQGSNGIGGSYGPTDAGGDAGTGTGGTGGSGGTTGGGRTMVSQYYEYWLNGQWYAGYTLTTNEIGEGGAYGGGGGSSPYGNQGSSGGGAVRIIWGQNRAFPSTDVAFSATTTGNDPAL